MNINFDGYKGKKVIVTGTTGFIGRALADKLVDSGAKVYTIENDVRNAVSFETAILYSNCPDVGCADCIADQDEVIIDHTFSYLFHFAAPSSQVLFKRNAAHCIDVTINGLINAAKTCQKHGIRLIYPSTGLLSQGRTNEYAMCKKISEDYIAGLGIDALGIRIFATYGPGESHKADYASVPYLFVRDIVNGKEPVIFGDGTQVRDFIHIDDTVRAVMTLAEECFEPIIDLGYGEQVSFNTIIDRINKALYGDSSSQYKIPKYIDKPGNYVSETKADVTKLNQFYKPVICFDDGIVSLVNNMLSHKA